MQESVSGAPGSQRVLPPPSQRVVPVFERIAEAAGAPLTPGCEVLDFGAGAGRHVAEFRDAGYAAVGVDQQHTSHAEGSVEAKYLYTVSPPGYRLPFDDQSFDFVFSTSVMEHVTDPGSALAEIARVLRPNALSIHVFPSRWRPLEPHMYTPFGGRVQSFWAYRLWAALGVRNEWQRDLPAVEVALRNTQYAKTGINYPTATEWRLRARRLFSEVSWAEGPFIEATAPVSRISRRLAPLSHSRLLQLVYRSLHTRVLVVRR